MPAKGSDTAPEAGAPEIEITPAMMEAGVIAYYENSGGEAWSSPGGSELKVVIERVFQAMWSNREST